MKRNSAPTLIFRGNICNNIGVYSYRRNNTEYLEIWNKSPENKEEIENNNGFILGFPWESADFLRDATDKIQNWNSRKIYCVYSQIKSLKGKFLHFQIWEDEKGVLEPVYYDEEYNLISLNKLTKNYKKAIKIINSYRREQNEYWLASQKKLTNIHKKYLKQSQAIA